MNLVVDASVLIDYLTQPEGKVDLAELYQGGASLHVPAICDTEVVSGLSRRVRARRSSEEDARDALTDYVGFPLARHLHPAFLGRVFELRENVSARDAAYVTLAEALDAALVTVDGALARAVRDRTDVPVLP
ncbi:MAG TPA: type II toxin-antitoxin system VapC family toxin [Actinomycetota bacterium]|nr:type II toxin-antitoxin system VapC family toxin [Actinomycetota bacterium]